MENRGAKHQTNLQPAFPQHRLQSILAFPKGVARGKKEPILK